MAEWKLTLDASDEKTTDITEEGGDTSETVKKSLAVDYKTSLSQTLDFTGKFTYDVTTEISQNDFDTTEIAPKLETEFKAQWWTFSADWEQKINSSDDPANTGTTETTYTVEVKIEPEYEDLPDVTYTFKGDKDTLTKTYQGVLEYSFLEMLDVKIDAKQENSVERDSANDDGQDRKLTTDVKFDHEPLDTLKVEAEWSLDRSQSLSFDSDGNITEETDTLDNKLNGKVTQKPFDWSEISLKKEVEWKKDLQVAEPSERTDKWTTDLSYDPELTSALKGELGYIDTREKKTGVDSPERNWNQEYALALTFEPLPLFKLNTSYDRKDEKKFPMKTGEEQSTKRNDDYKFEAESKSFNDQITFKVTREIKYTWEDGAKTGLDRNWEITTEISWENIPNLTLKPSYKFDQDTDAVEQSNIVKRESKMDLGYKIELGDVTKFDLGHVFTRTSNYPDDELYFVERKDETTLKLELSDFLEGMKLGGEYTRNASDKSGDDVGPELSYKHTFTYEWLALDTYNLKFGYEHELGNKTEDKENFDTAISFKIFNDKVEVKFEHEYSNKLQGDEEQKHRYLIEIKGEF
jgi:hypothetical protein